jgi:2-polyprenyl-6-methoxyphenol hydroxylase-like FAD-dependent oxidoreductase
VTGEEALVLIVGGSLVGLSTAVFLGSHGVRCLAVERHAGTAIHPRAAHFNQRTTEIYRSVGLEAAIMEAAGREFVQDGAIMSVETLAGRELEWFFRNVNEGVEDLSPARQLFVTQKGLEPILRARAEELGARLEYSQEAVSLEQDDEGVTALLRRRDTGEERTVRARYVVAADGSRSPVRERLGIPLRGRGTFSKSLTIYFRADVRPLLRGRNLSVVYVFNPQVKGFLRFELAGGAGFLAASRALDATGQPTSDLSQDMSEARCVELVRAALGVADLPVEIENVQPWNASADWAERFQDGRIFLAGDAAHAMPPNGGFGGNTGVADAHNLAWKLAFVLRGDAGPELLDTYDAERRPVGVFTAEQAYTRYVVRLAQELRTGDLEPYVEDPSITLGHRYRSGAVVAEGDDDGAAYENPREPSGRPGFRAPHVDLGGRSTLDLFGRGFVVLSPSRAWCDASPVEAHRIDAPAFVEAYGTGPEGASLVRPDGFVAWRARRADPEPERALAATLSDCLGV